MLTSLRRTALVSAALAGSLLGLTCAAAATVRGPDVSRWQHPHGFSINWSAAHTSGDGAAFAFVKATEGATYVNPYFRRDFDGLATNHMARGAYHFAQPKAGTAAAQARHFVAAAGTLHAPGDLPAVLDLEVTGGLGPRKLIAWTHTYLRTVEQLTGRTPILYTYPVFWSSAMANTHEFTRYPLWIATYGPRPHIVGGWPDYTFWQYTNHANVAGMPGPVDMSVFRGSMAQLRALANDAAPTGGTSGPQPAAPGTPTQLVLNAARGKINATWAPGDGGPVRTWVVRVDGGAPQRVPANTRTYTATPLPAGPHQVEVAARNAAGCSAFVTGTAVVPAGGTLSVPLPASAYPGTAHLADRSPVRIRAHLSATSAHPGARVVLRGHTARKLAGARVYRLSWHAGGWDKRAVARVDRLGRFRFPVRAGTAPRQFHQVYLPGVPGRHRGAISATLTLRVTS